MSIEKNTNFIPIRTIKTKLNTIPIQSGQIILVIDTQEIYLDCIKDSTLQRILFNTSKFLQERNEKLCQLRKESKCLTVKHNIIFCWRIGRK